MAPIGRFEKKKLGRHRSPLLAISTRHAFNKLSIKQFSRHRSRIIFTYGGKDI